MPHKRKKHPVTVTLARKWNDRAGYTEFERVPLTEWMSVKRRATTSPMRPIEPQSAGAESAANTVVKMLEEFFEKAAGSPRRRALAFCRAFCGETINVPSFAALQHLDDPKGDLAKALPPPRRIDDSIRSNLALFTEYFASASFKKNDSPGQQAAELIRSLSSCSFNIPEIVHVETYLRNLKLGAMIHRDGSSGNRSRLSRTAGITRESLAKIARGYAKDHARQIERDRDMKIDVDRFFPAPERRSKKVGV